MRRTVTMLMLPLLVLTGCGGPTDEQIEDAKGRVSSAVAAIDLARHALTVLGLLPTYECGEPRRTFVGKAVEGAKRDIACATITTESSGETDAVKLAFPESGCGVKDLQLSGTGAFVYSGGEDRFELNADLSQLAVGGTKLQTSAGYGACGDEQRYFARSSGSVPRRPELTFSVDLHVGKRDGIPVIGGTTLLLNGPGEIAGPNGADRLTFTSVEYELGEYLPKSGTILIESAGGTRIEATFTTVLWRLGEAEIRIDDHDPVTVPIIR